MYQQLTRSLPIVAKAVGASLGVKVHFCPELRACTDHAAIYLPNLKAIGSEEDAVVLEGMLDHEAAHVRFTDKRWTEKAFNRGPMFRSIYNIIEDGRIEKEQGRLYPGSRRNLSRMCEILARLGFFSDPDGEQHPAAILSSQLLYGLRNRHLGQAFCKTWSESALRNARALFGEQLADQILEEAMRGAALDGGSASAYAAADRITALIEQMQAASAESGAESTECNESNESTESTESTESNESAEGAEGAESADGADGAEQSESGQAEKTPSSGKGSAGRGHAGSDASGDGQQSEAESISQSILQANEDEIGSYGKDIETRIKDAGMVEAGNHDSAEQERLLTCPRRKVNEQTLERIQKARSLTTRLSLRLDDLLTSRSRTDRRSARSGKLDARRLASIRVKNLNVFERCDESVAIDTAVFILIDRSGSMAGSQLANAVDASVAFGLVSEHNSVHVSAAMFGDDILPLGDFGQNWKSHVANMSHRTDGGTSMGSAVSFSVGKLLEFGSAERRILLIVTDGEPNDFDTFRAAIEECKRYGVDVAACLISPHKAYENAFRNIMPIGVSHDPQDIPKAIFNMLKEMI